VIEREFELLRRDDMSNLIFYADQTQFDFLD